MKQSLSAQFINVLLIEIKFQLLDNQIKIFCNINNKQAHRKYLDIPHQWKFE